MDEKPVRCAIYTRKSTEEGLEQEFNSLEAQREAAAAYIASQRQAGWVALPQRYDDGGFSGASLDRPALRQLLAGVEAGSIDCVVVYKVDRLSRSLPDFARLIELFDGAGVSFVSVTQEFNTTTSLGRLTLNILFSFAQFERDIIGERTRDKLGAARRKGKWTGGSPVLGYDINPQGGRIVVNESEAGRVRAIFEIAAQTGSFEAAFQAVRAQCLQTKQWTSRSGRQHGGGPFSRTTLRCLLSNVLYTGAVSWRGTVYPGEHAAIVDTQVWRQVNERLRMNGTHQAGRAHRKQDALLANLLCCGECGGPMRPTHTRRHGQLYRYYVCAAAQRSRRQECRQRRVAATDIEPSIADHLEPVLGTGLSGPVIQQSLDRVIYDGSTRRVSLRLRDGTRLEYTLPVAVRPGVSAADTKHTGNVPRVSRLMALAVRLERLVAKGVSGDHSDLADAGQISRPRLSQILRLRELAPAIQEEILFLPKTLTGRDPVTERALRQLTGIIDWDEQVKQFRSLMDSARIASAAPRQPADTRCFRAATE
jgi:site-specific DNA recombinase